MPRNNTYIKKLSAKQAIALSAKVAEKEYLKDSKPLEKNESKKQAKAAGAKAALISARDLIKNGEGKDLDNKYLEGLVRNNSVSQARAEIKEEKSFTRSVAKVALGVLDVLVVLGDILLTVATFKDPWIGVWGGGSGGFFSDLIGASPGERQAGVKGANAAKEFREAVKDGKPLGQALDDAITEKSISNIKLSPNVAIKTNANRSKPLSNSVTPRINSTSSSANTAKNISVNTLIATDTEMQHSAAKINSPGKSFNI